jgi:hypothetical protein
MNKTAPVRSPSRVICGLFSMLIVAGAIVVGGSSARAHSSCPICEEPLAPPPTCEVTTNGSVVTCKASPTYNPDAWCGSTECPSAGCCTTTITMTLNGYVCDYRFYPDHEDITCEGTSVEKAVVVCINC